MDVDSANPIVFSGSRTRANAVAGLIILGFAFWLSLEARQGTMWLTDELLTAERTREMLMSDPWVVSYNFHRSFEKPPLQYWLTGLTLPRIQDPGVAVRIWPLVYGVGTAVALGWLILLIKPEDPWLIPLSVAILFSSPLFSTESARGLLDIGLAFFTTLTIVFARLARKQPAWWLAAALTCWLGSLQKTPVPSLVWVLILIVRMTDREERAKLQQGLSWLGPSLLLSIGLMSFWPLLQLIKYEMPLGREFQQEVVVWLGPENLGRRPYLEILKSLSLHPGGFCGFLSLIALFLVLFSKRLRAPGAIRELAIVTLAFLVITIISNFREIRYVIPVLPLLCFVLGFVVYRFLTQPPPIRTVASLALIVLLTAGFVHAEIHIHHHRRNVADEKVIAEKLGQIQQPGMEIVLIKADIPGNDLLWDSFYLFHGRLRSPVTKYTVDEIRAGPPQPPLIGACVSRDLPVLQQLYPNIHVELARSQFICWSVPALNE
jgi:4-amino-4-deoxy-L-arabinose transferase-like glycosyltransferase